MFVEDKSELHTLVSQTGKIDNILIRFPTGSANNRKFKMIKSVETKRYQITKYRSYGIKIQEFTIKLCNESK